jgi:hypothetical protein
MLMLMLMLMLILVVYVMLTLMLIRDADADAVYVILMLMLILAVYVILMLMLHTLSSIPIGPLWSGLCFCQTEIWRLRTQVGGEWCGRRVVWEVVERRVKGGERRVCVRERERKKVGGCELYPAVLHLTRFLHPPLQAPLRIVTG